ncbi:MAG: hypothetical protein HON65_13735 [Rhodospirillales bacterium]|jgi:hypothetical protein|nr:hypothetical protein [Rhodospirillales bacterium]
MKTSSILETLASALDLNNTKKKKEALKTALKKLKKKENSYRVRLDELDNDDDRAELKNKLKVVKAQRKKGVKALRELNEKD